MLHALPSVLLMGCSSDRLEWEIHRLLLKQGLPEIHGLLRKDKGFSGRFSRWQQQSQSASLSDGRTDYQLGLTDTITPRDGPASLLGTDCT